MTQAMEKHDNHPVRIVLIDKGLQEKLPPSNRLNRSTARPSASSRTATQAAGLLQRAGWDGIDNIKSENF